MKKFYTYILLNNITRKYYIGATNDLLRRLEEHNRGQTKSTRKRGVWEIVYKEEFNTSVEAKKRERLIKSYKGGNAFKKLFAAVVYR